MHETGRFGDGLPARYVEAEFAEKSDLARDIYLTEGTEVTVYGTEEYPEKQDLVVDHDVEEDGWTDLWRIVDASDTAHEAMASWTKRLDGDASLRIELRDDEGGNPDIEAQGLKDYYWQDGLREQRVSAYTQDFRRYMKDCNNCADPVMVHELEPEAADRETYQVWDCDACGFTGSAEKDYEREGRSFIATEVQDRDEDFGRILELAPEARVDVYDLGDAEGMLPTSEEEFEERSETIEESRLYGMRLGLPTVTTLESLVRRPRDAPVPVEGSLYETIEEHMEDPHLGVVIRDVAGCSTVEDAETSRLVVNQRDPDHMYRED